MIKEPFVQEFNMQSGLSSEESTTARYLSRVKGMFADEAAYEEKLAEGDVKIYDFTELGFDEVEQDLLFGTSITYPGKIGNEYFMTKGHFHTILDLAEVYFCLGGEGYLLLETPEGEWKAEYCTPGKAVYVPGRWAHRSINVGTEPFITYFVFRADAGHDYGSIEDKGFRKLMVEQDGKPTIIDNPKWKSEGAE